jgi:hypothetical protein
MPRRPVKPKSTDRQPEKRRTKRLATTSPGERCFSAHWLAEDERESESHTQAQLADGMAVDRRVAHRGVEGELIVHLPYGSDQARERLRLGDNAVRIDFKNRPDFPFARSLDDGVEKELTMLIGREVRRRIQMNRSPIPPLRYYSGQAKSDTRSCSHFTADATLTSKRSAASRRDAPVSKTNSSVTLSRLSAAAN